MSPEFREIERQGTIDIGHLYPCCECGRDSDCYAEFVCEPGQPKEWLCKECCDKDSQ